MIVFLIIAGLAFLGMMVPVVSSVSAAGKFPLTPLHCRNTLLALTVAALSGSL